MTIESKEQELKALKAKMDKVLKEIEALKATPKSWRANSGGEYYTILRTGEVSYDIDERLNADNERYATGNYFKTETDATNSNLHILLNPKGYDYWFAGFSKLPDELPEDCERWEFNEWVEESYHPDKWSCYNRRWRKV